MNMQDQLRQGTVDPSSGNKLWWSYYDRIIFAAATLNHVFFSAPLGTGGKGLSDTNWKIANVLPDNEKFTIYALEFFFIPDAAKTQAQYQNLVDVLGQSYIDFYINGKSSQLLLPLIQAFGLSFPLIVTPVAAGDTQTARSSVKGAFELPVPIVLAANTSLNVRYTLTTAGNASLDGDKLYLACVGTLEYL